MACYYFGIRGILKTRPELKAYLKRCRHCQILFFTHPRNTIRNDLRCLFGCRDAHRAIQSSKRSIEYNRTNKGKKKKAALNQRRCKKQTGRGGSVQDRSESKSYETNRDTMIHIQIIIRFVEGYRMDLDRINHLIHQMRQHSIDFHGKLNYPCSRGP